MSWKTFVVYVLAITAGYRLASDAIDAIKKSRACPEYPSCEGTTHA